MAVAQNDSLDLHLNASQTITREDILEEPPLVRLRDAPIEQFRKTTVAPANDEKYRVWEVKSGNGPAQPFYPNASFKALIQSNKLQTNERASYPHLESKYLAPGYTGFIQGRQHTSGRTYGEMTRRAYSMPYEEHVQTSPIPSDPQANRRIEQEVLPDRFMYGIQKKGPNYTPGYTGHVPGYRHSYGNTYGSSTREHIAKFQQAHPRGNPQEREGYAYTMKRRSRLHIDSMPIPGAPCTQQHPTSLVPSKTTYLKYFNL